MKIAIITSRRAYEEVRQVIDRIKDKRKDIDIEVVSAPIDVASLMSMDVLRMVVKNIEDKYDMVIVPGTLPYALEELRRISPKIVKGPLSPTQLAMLVKLDNKELEEILSRGEFKAMLSLESVLAEISRVHRAKEGIDVCGVKVPIRPPPFVVAAEVFAYAGRDDREEAERLAIKSKELLSRGADIIIVGFGYNWYPENALRVVKKIYEEVGPVGIDSPNHVILVKAVEQGYSCLSLSVWNGSSLLDKLPRGHSVVVIPSAPTSEARDISNRIDTLAKGVTEAKKRGLQAIADPIVDPPLMGLADSIVAYKLASEKLSDVPLLAGIANVYELLDVDSHGVIGTLVPLFGELGVSVLLVGEESTKTRYAVTETAIAATMVSIALIKHSVPKDLGLDLLSIKEKRRRPSPKTPKNPSMILNAKHIASWHGFRQDLTGTHIIVVEDGMIRDVYIGRKGTLEVRGESAEEVYKAIAYLGLAKEPSHYAFLGKELYKAELALRFSRSYIMEEPILLPPWLGRKYYSAKRMGLKEAP